MFSFDSLARSSIVYNQYFNINNNYEDKCNNNYNYDNNNALC